MPISRNHKVKSVAPKSVFPDASALVDSTISFNQGDLIVLDTTAHLLKAVQSGELGTKFVGVATQSIVNGKPVSPVQGTDVDASEGIPALQGPEYGSTFKLVAKTADAFNPGDKVYIDGASGTRNVTSTVGSSVPIGVYQGPAIASAAAGQEIEVLVGAQYPNDVLSF